MQGFENLYPHERNDLPRGSDMKLFLLACITIILTILMAFQIAVFSVLSQGSANKMNQQHFNPTEQAVFDADTARDTVMNSFEKFCSGEARCTLIIGPSERSFWDANTQASDYIKFNYGNMNIWIANDHYK